MNLENLVKKTRSYRRFDQSVPVSEEMLVGLIDMARLTGSAGNKQPLRYMVSTDQKMNSRIFPNLAWAGALPDWPGPDEGERPAAYIVIASEKESWWEWSTVDLGVVAQTILLGASVHDLGGCMIGVFKRKELGQVLELPADHDLRLVIALGRPVEEVVLEEVPRGSSLTYYRTNDRVHHVPKLTLEEVILKRW